MIDTRKTFEVELGNGDKLHRLVLRTPPSAVGGEKSWYYVTTLLQLVSQSPEILNPDGMEFETLTLKHKSGAWELETQAVRKKVEPQSSF